MWFRRIYEFLCVHSNPIWKGRNCRDHRPSHLTFREYFQPFWFSRSCVVVGYCNRRMRSSNVQGFVSMVPTLYEEEEEDYAPLYSNRLLERHKKKSLLNRIVTGHGKWIHYNPKCKKSCETRPNSQINGKAEYPWREGNALYLVGSEGCAVLWAAETGWNHQWRTLPNIINPFEVSNSRKTPGIWEQTRGNNFPSWQRSAPCCYSS